ncbi:CPBP family intramembrane metalloprotease [bacterium]|nr:CPBP family intramembrane metalloprotease [bacterium]
MWEKKTGERVALQGMSRFVETGKQRTKNRRSLFGLLGLFILAIAGIFYTVHNYENAFPEVSIPMQYEKEQASEMLDSILVGFGANPKSFKSAVVMDQNSAMTYIDKEFGRDSIPKIHIRDKIPIWSWYKRYFVPLQKEEYSISIRPDDGALARFVHTIPESLSGADIASDSAKIISDSFLVSLGYNLDEYELKNTTSEKKPNRRDHRFTYEKKGWSLGDSKNWITIGVCGDKIGSFSHSLHIPEGWWRKYSKTRSENSLFQNADQFFAAIFVLAMLIYLVLAFRKKGLAIKFGAISGIVVFAASFLMTINLLPLSILGYNTMDSYAGFIFQQILYAIFSGALQGFLTFIAAVAGEKIYREFLPKFHYLPQLFSPSGWRTKSFRTAVLAGYLFAFAHLGFVVFYYVFGKKIGIWAPTDSNYTNLMSTYFPWLFALSIGLMASLSEDFMFRLFGVPFLSKIFKSKVIGIIIPAFIWGFLHSSYPQEPGWARGIEIGLIGIAAGWMMLRYSIVANITWHFAIDAGLTSFMIVRQGNATNIVISVLVVLLPAILIGLGYIFGKKREIALNEEIVFEESKVRTKIPEKIIPISYQKMPSRKKYVWVSLAIIGLIIAIFTPKSPGQSTSIDREKAKSLAKNLLASKNVPVDSFKTVEWIDRAPSNKELRYLYQRMGMQGIEKLYGENKWEPLYYWKVRFIISSKKNEYRVLFRPDGDIQIFEHYLEESDSGATISQDSAFILAKKLLNEFGKGNILNWELIEKSTKKRPNRADHYFVWQSNDSIGQAHKRVGIVVLGDKASFSKLFLKRPEEWDRNDSKNTALTTIRGILPILLIAILILFVIIVFIKGIAKNNINFKLMLWAFSIPAFFALLSFINNYSTILSGYYTAWTIERFLTIQFISKAIGVIFAGVGAALVVGAFSATKFRRKLLMKIPTGETLLISAIATFTLLGIYSIIQWLEISFDLPIRNISLAIPSGFASYLPALGVFDEIVSKIFIILPALFIAYFVLREKIDKNSKLFIILLVIAAIMGLDSSKTLGEILWGILKAIAIATTGWFIVKNLFKDNVPLYIATIILAFGLRYTANILQSSGNTFFIINGIAAGSITIILWISSALYSRPKNIAIGENRQVSNQPND